MCARLSVHVSTPVKHAPRPGDAAANVCWLRATPGAADSKGARAAKQWRLHRSKGRNGACSQAAVCRSGAAGSKRQRSAERAAVRERGRATSWQGVWVGAALAGKPAAAPRRRAAGAGRTQMQAGPEVWPVYNKRCAPVGEAKAQGRPATAQAAARRSPHGARRRRSRRAGAPHGFGPGAGAGDVPPECGAHRLPPGGGAGGGGGGGGEGRGRRRRLCHSTHGPSARRPAHRAARKTRPGAQNTWARNHARPPRARAGFRAA
jgi:hypothetical protein